MQTTITLAQVRLAMEARDAYNQAAVFSIVFVKCNRRKKEGGQMLRLPAAARYSNLEATANRKEFRSPKNDHWKNQTINLVVMQKNEVTRRYESTNKIIACHLRLITHFNDLEVIW